MLYHHPRPVNLSQALDLDVPEENRRAAMFAPEADASPGSKLGHRDPKLPLEPVIARSGATWQIPPSPPFTKGGCGGIIMEIATLPSVDRNDKKISDLLFLSAISGRDR